MTNWTSNTIEVMGYHPELVRINATLEEVSYDLK
jgi:hypothetical protein